MIQPTTVETYFGDLPDPRTGPALLHKLIDILTIALLAVICGADDWVEVHDFGEAHHDWLKTFLELPNGTQARPMTPLDVSSRCCSRRPLRNAS